LAIITLTSPIKGRETFLLAKDFLRAIIKKQRRWIRPIKKQDEATERKQLGNVDWDIPGHQRIHAVPQAKDIVEWAQNLGLINVKRKNMWTSFGAILSKITTQNQKDAFLCHIELPNPLRLTLKQKIFFLYLILQRDGDFMVPFMRKFPKDKKFSAKESVDYYFDTWQELVERLQSSKEYSHINIGKQLSRSISALKRVSAYERVKSKLENLTDLGILNRVDERNYNYLSNADKLQKLNTIPSDKDFLASETSFEKAWVSFFDNYFFSRAADIFEIQASDGTEEIVTKHVLETYSTLVGGLGLCRIDEICLLTGIDALCSSEPIIIEQKTSRKAIYDLNKKYGKLVSLHVDMLGNISYVKIDKSVLNKV